VEWTRATASARARLLTAIGLGLLLALLLGGPARAAGAAAADDDGPQPVTVRILASGLEPAMVQIEPGATVTWVNESGATRTIMAADASFDSGAMEQGERFQFAFTEPTTVTYSVTQAPQIQGQITVAAGGQPAPAAAPAPAPVAGDPFGQGGQDGTTPPADPTAQPSGFAFTGSSTAVNGLIGGTLVAIGAGLLYSMRRYGVAGTFARLTFAPRSDDLLPSRRHRRERRDSSRRRFGR
jgi:plastocyanin